MRRMGRRPSDDEMEEGIAGPFRKADFRIEDAELDFSQFVVFLAGTSTKAQRSLKKQIRDLREAFDLFDDDHGGSVSLEEFAGTMVMFGRVDLAQDELEKMLAPYATRGDGEIDFVEFVGMIVSEDPNVQVSSCA